jgi:hypothetical protein
MDISWLTDFVFSILNVFSPLKSIAHWKIWAELLKWYERFKKWVDWYREHVIKPMRAEQQALARIRDKFIMPVIKLIDHIRQLTQIVGIFSKGLAAKLNYQFLKVEGYLLKPFNDATARINQLYGTFGGFLTALGYFDRATLLNSIWRDAGLIRQTLWNPWNVPPESNPLPTPKPLTDVRDETVLYLNTQTGPLQTDVQKGIESWNNSRQELGV